MDTSPEGTAATSRAPRPTGRGIDARVDDHRTPNPHISVGGRDPPDDPLRPTDRRYPPKTLVIRAIVPRSQRSVSDAHCCPADAAASLYNQMVTHTTEQSCGAQMAFTV